MLLLLHQSPQSSREFEGLMQQWSGFFTLIAPDSPGYGLSDPLKIAVADLDDFAAATIEFLDSIGVNRFGAYGFHTGGMIGMALADNYPKRVSALACNGVVVPTPDELTDILTDYLPPFEPRWDGGHLAWLWARTREQTIFFPWHKHSLEARMDFTMPSPEHQQNSLLEFLRASAHYHVAYRAAFMYRADQVVARLHVPTVITATRGDPLQSHLERLGSPVPGVEFRPAETPQEALECCLALLEQNPGDKLSTDRYPASRSTGVERKMVATTLGPMHVLRAGSSEAPTFMLVHGPGSSSNSLVALLDAIGINFQVVAIDLPGHGESALLAPNADDAIKVCVDALCEVLSQLAIARPHLVGIDGGCIIALELARRLATPEVQLYLLDPPLLDDAETAAWKANGIPAMAAEWSGGHLLRCWHMVRDGRLYFPWFRRDRTAIRWQEPDLQEQTLQLEVTDYLKAEGSWQRLLAAQLNYPLLQELLSGPHACIGSTAASPWLPRLQSVSAQHRWTFDSLENGPEATAWWLCKRHNQRRRKLQPHDRIRNALANKPRESAGDPQ